jgi:hypothetical protein
VLDLDLPGLQLGGQSQPDVRKLLARLGEHRLTVLLELLAERIDVRLVELVAGAFRRAA